MVPRGCVWAVALLLCAMAQALSPLAPRVTKEPLSPKSLADALCTCSITDNQEYATDVLEWLDDTEIAWSFCPEKIPDQFRRYQNKKREQAVKMMECIEARKVSENSAVRVLPQSKGINGEENSASGGDEKRRKMGNWYVWLQLFSSPPGSTFVLVMMAVFVVTSLT